MEDETLKTYLSENWDTLTDGKLYTTGAFSEGIQAKVYNGEEYLVWQDTYYLVEPIRWRIISNGNQEVGYGEVSEEGIMAVMDTIVYAGRFSDSEITENQCYSTVARAVFYGSYGDENNGIDSTYLINWTQSMPTFGTTSLNGSNQSWTDRMFVSSIEEIEQVTGSREVKFSDFVYDYMIVHHGVVPLCWTRDLGSNYNNILCLNENGDITQRKPNIIINQLGVQFTIKISEYACVD